jgi:hypothetical protein
MEHTAHAPPDVVNVSKGRSRAGLILASRFGPEGEVTP